jgi:hypothetical protein
MPAVSWDTDEDFASIILALQDDSHMVEYEWGT